MGDGISYHVSRSYLLRHTYQANIYPSRLEDLPLYLDQTSHCCSIGANFHHFDLATSHANESDGDGDGDGMAMVVAMA